MFSRSFCAKRLTRLGEARESGRYIKINALVISANVGLRIARETGEITPITAMRNR